MDGIAFLLHLQAAPMRWWHTHLEETACQMSPGWMGSPRNPSVAYHLKRFVDMHV